MKPVPIKSRPVHSILDFDQDELIAATTGILEKKRVTAARSRHPAPGTIPSLSSPKLPWKKSAPPC